MGIGCGWVKLNVLQKRWLVCWLASLLILRSFGIFSFFCLSVYGRVWFFTMTPNSLIPANNLAYSPKTYSPPIVYSKLFFYSILRYFIYLFSIYQTDSSLYLMPDYSHVYIFGSFSDYYAPTTLVYISSLFLLLINAWHSYVVTYVN